MISLTYTITLKQPLLATTLNGEPNSAVSALYIPGSMIRGLLIARHGVINGLAISARPLFFDGQVRYLHAYPMHPTRSDYERSLPLPASWCKEKKRSQKAGEMEDRALLARADSEWETQAEDEETVSDKFVWLDEQQATTYTPATQITVHTQRAPSAGRATSAEGAVYRYEALAAGEQFMGIILCDNETLAKQVKALLTTGTSYLGGAQTAGYGSVILDLVRIEDNKNKKWSEYKHTVEEIPAGGRLVITLLSDTLLRDANGAPHTDLVAALKLPLTQEQAFKQVAVVGGFNRKWGLPLPQMQALGAGSVFVCRTTDRVTGKQLENLLEYGTGERRVEGFGRLAFNWQTEGQLYQRKSPTRNAAQSDLKLPTVTSDPVYQLAQRMVNRRHRQVLDQGLIKAVAKFKIINAPPNSQLAGVRVIARHALQAGDLKRISNLFNLEINGEENLEAIKLPARQKFERARIGVKQERLAEWLKALADNPVTVWQHFDQGQEANPLGSVGLAPTEHLAAEYAVRLIDGVLGQAMQERRGNERKMGGKTNGTA